MMTSSPLLMLAALGLAWGADPAVEERPNPRGTRRALIICGHPGDAEHQTLFADAVTKLRQGLTENFDFAEDHVSVMFGVDPDGPAALDFPTAGPATSEAVSAAIVELRSALQPDDALWVIVVGHSHFDGRMVWINLPGPDVNQEDFGRLFRDLPCREQLFWLSVPASGYCLKPLAARGRVVISATEADLEVNATLMAFALAEELLPTAEHPAADVDQDGLLTLRDLYLAVARNTVQRYLADMLIVTEHALLDDNGDGRGTELQRDYLTEEEGGRKRAGFKPTHQPGGDGTLAGAIQLPLSPVSALSALPVLPE